MKNLTTQTWATVRAQRRILMLSAAAALSWLYTGGTAAQLAQSAGGTGKATAASVRDLEPFFYMPLPDNPAFPASGTDTVAIGLPVPPSKVLRNLLTSAELPQNFFGNPNLILKRRNDPISRSFIKPFQLFANARYTIVSSQTPGGYTEALGFERLQPNIAATIVRPNGGFTDRYVFGAPVVRTTLDGSLYEAAPVTVERNGSLYSTLHYGYRMGIVAGQTAASVPAAEQQAYDLVSLPAPTIEGRVTEYIYRPVADGTPPRLHVFYAASDAERVLLDESEVWMRSGLEFKNGGYLPVCRFFYQPPNGAQATHFYTAKPEECAQLKTTAGFTYEGTPFRASLPKSLVVGEYVNNPARCPEKTVPLWRFFNKPTDSTVAPNHRYLLNRVLGGAQTPTWADEGIGLCVPE